MSTLPDDHAIIKASSAPDSISLPVLTPRAGRREVSWADQITYGTGHGTGHPDRPSGSADKEVSPQSTSSPPPRRPTTSDPGPLFSVRNRQSSTARSSSPSSSASERSSTRFAPTSTSVPATIIKAGLLAAHTAHQAKQKDQAVVHILRHSNGSPGRSSVSKRSSLRISSSSIASDKPTTQSDIPVPNSDVQETSIPQTRRSTSHIAPPEFATLAQKYLEADPSTHLWSCVDLLKNASQPKSYAMIILNQPIVNKDVFTTAWHASECTSKLLH